MSIVNFAIPAAMEKRITDIIKKKEFASKAEFFRLAAIYFMDIINKPVASEGGLFEFLSRSLEKELSILARSKKMPTLREQMKEV